ncbi:unnamed protein product [Closterium sp. NIES-64]|nr:unnamed protein product [Closterium sp. NIES-64]
MADRQSLLAKFASSAVAVLLAFAVLSSRRAEAQGEPDWRAKTASVLQQVSQQEFLSSFAAIFSEFLQGGQQPITAPATLLVPTNVGHWRYLSHWTALSPTHQRRLLHYHILPGRYTAQQLLDAPPLTLFPTFNHHLPLNKTLKPEEVFFQSVPLMKSASPLNMPDAGLTEHLAAHGVTSNSDDDDEGEKEQPMMPEAKERAGHSKPAAADDGRGKGARRPAPPSSPRAAVRYTKSVLSSTLQLMGCKSRHAVKISERVFQILLQQLTSRRVSGHRTDVAHRSRMANGSDGIQRFARPNQEDRGAVLATGASHDNHSCCDSNGRDNNEQDESRAAAGAGSSAGGDTVRGMSVSLKRSTFLDVVCRALAEYRYLSADQRSDLALACNTATSAPTSAAASPSPASVTAGHHSTDSQRHRMSSFSSREQATLCHISSLQTVFLSCVLSLPPLPPSRFPPLSPAGASRLGITTVVSTDSLRHMMRGFSSREETKKRSAILPPCIPSCFRPLPSLLYASTYPLLYASTYQAGEHLDPAAVADTKARKKAGKLAGKHGGAQAGGQGDAGAQGAAAQRDWHGGRQMGQLAGEVVGQVGRREMQGGVCVGSGERGGEEGLGSHEGVWLGEGRVGGEGNCGGGAVMTGGGGGGREEREMREAVWDGRTSVTGLDRERSGEGGDEGRRRDVGSGRDAVNGKEPMSVAFGICVLCCTCIPRGACSARAFTSHMPPVSLTSWQMELLKRHPTIIPFVIYIGNEAKHMERFADYLVRRADKHLIPKMCYQLPLPGRYVLSLHLLFSATFPLLRSNARTSFLGGFSNYTVVQSQAIQASAPPTFSLYAHSVSHVSSPHFNAQGYLTPISLLLHHLLTADATVWYEQLLTADATVWYEQLLTATCCLLPLSFPVISIRCHLPFIGCDLHISTFPPTNTPISQVFWPNMLACGSVPRGNGSIYPPINSSTGELISTGVCQQPDSAFFFHGENFNGYRRAVYKVRAAEGRPAAAFNLTYVWQCGAMKPVLPAWMSDPALVGPALTLFDSRHDARGAAGSSDARSNSSDDSSSTSSGESNESSSGREGPGGEYDMALVGTTLHDLIQHPTARAFGALLESNLLPPLRAAMRDPSAVAVLGPWAAREDSKPPEFIPVSNNARSMAFENELIRRVPSTQPGALSALGMMGLTLPRPDLCPDSTHYAWPVTLAILDLWLTPLCTAHASHGPQH